MRKRYTYTILSVIFMIIIILYVSIFLYKYYINNYTIKLNNYIWKISINDRNYSRIYNKNNQEIINLSCIELSIDYPYIFGYATDKNKSRKAFVINTKNDDVHIFNNNMKKFRTYLRAYQIQKKIQYTTFLSFKGQHADKKRIFILEKEFNTKI